MEFYFIDPAIMKQIMSELLCAVGVTAFNNLIARRNFCSSNRGMQIQYNVSKIEEWCKMHEVCDNTQNLDRLLQLAKVLQMNKRAEEDLKVICEVSDLLNASKKKLLIKKYKPTDTETPVPNNIFHHELLFAPENEAVLISSNDLADQVLYLTARKVPAIETFIPDSLMVRRLRALVESQTNVSYDDDGMDYDNEAGRGGGEYPQQDDKYQSNGSSTLNDVSTDGHQVTTTSKEGGGDGGGAGDCRAITGLGLDTPTLTEEYEYKH